LLAESLVHDLSVPAESTFLEDLKKLQSPEILEEKIPAYILARQDESADWLAIYYVPENAKIRDKVC
jgi:twinfilin